jgi:hypothetical protein
MLLVQLWNAQQSALVRVVIQGYPVESGGDVRVGEVGPVRIKVATCRAFAVNKDGERFVVVEDSFAERQVSTHGVNSSGEVLP